jgi:hypothetical protein
MLGFENVGLNAWAVFAGVAGLFIGGIMLKWVSSSVGLKFAWQLFMMKKKINKRKILLKIWLPSGTPIYKKVDACKMIEYSYKENGKDKLGMVMYDHYAKYNEFNNIPVIECSPDDIIPRNPFAKTSMTISPEIAKKNIVDSSKETTQGDNIKKWLKYAIPILAIFGAILVLYSSNQSETIAELSRELAQCYANTRSATIVGG